MQDASKKIILCIYIKFCSSEAVRLDLEYYEYQEGSISSADRNVRLGILTLLIFKSSLSLLWTNSVVV